MRTIKFRGKRLDNGEWLVGWYAKGFWELPEVVEIDVIITRVGGYEVIPESVGQWTGLVDRHGKEIFEGDVVKAENTQNIGEIKYVHEHGSFLAYSHDENGAYYEYLDIGLCEKYFEVIGNIHDKTCTYKDSGCGSCEVPSESKTCNPELMEVE